MKLSLRWREAIRKISPYLEDDLTGLIAALQKWTNAVTTPSATATALAATRFTLNGVRQPVVLMAVSTTNLDTSSATLADVPGLSLSLAAHTSYAFDALLHIPTVDTVSVALGGTVTVDGVAGNPSISYFIEMINSTTDVIDNAHGSHTSYGLGTTHSSLTGTGYLTIRWEGWFKTLTAGTLTIQFAKFTGGGSAVTLRRGSWLRASQLD